MKILYLFVAFGLGFIASRAVDHFGRTDWAELDMTARQHIKNQKKGGGGLRWWH